MAIKVWLAGLAVIGVAVAIPATASASAPRPHLSAVKKVSSATLAGYEAVADKGTKFRYVTADLTVEWPLCPGFGPGDSAVFYQWAGLAGHHGPAEQIGLYEVCAEAIGYGGYTDFGAWYGDGPGKATDFLDCIPAYQPCPRGPNPGDRIQLSVYFNGKSYRLRYYDVTSRTRRTFYVRCSTCRNNSAGVIEQGDYHANGPPVSAMAIDFFGVRVTSVTGRHGTVTALPKYWTSTEFIMVDSEGRDLAVPSALLRHGRAFHVEVSAPAGCGC